MMPALPAGGADAPVGLVSEVFDWVVLVAMVVSTVNAAITVPGIERWTGREVRSLLWCQLAATSSSSLFMGRTEGRPGEPVVVLLTGLGSSITEWVVARKLDEQVCPNLSL